MDQDGAEQMRMSSFSFGKPSLPLDASMSSKPTRHSRSHSRNSSVSISMSFPPPLPSLASLPSASDSPPHSPTRSSLGGAKRNSHHRRRSSVSTRRESADMMGVSLPSLPQSSSEDNINLGDKDSVRRRALWALEGKPDTGHFSVEIPELDMPEMPKRSLDFPSKPSFPPGVGAGFGGGLNALLGSRRDSKFIVSSPSSELLGTLIEEEEEERDEYAQASPVQESPTASQVAVMVTSPSPAPARHRPANLNLRPLSLALSNSVQASNGELPTPSPTPSPRPALKSLTLPSSQSLSGLSSNAASNRRQSLIMPSPDPTSNSFGRRPSLNLSMDSTVAAPQPSRRSSISYVSSNEVQAVSMFGLPTPEMTPTSSTIDRRRSTSTSSTSSFDMDHLRGRPLSTSEQHFLFQAHQTLVQRITDLERALKRTVPRSRPVSCASDSSSSTALEPSDEMLQLIADLKSERDELKKDVDGWRSRVADMEHQIDLHAKRLDVERRDAWVARQRLGLLEVEKSALEKTVSEKTTQAVETQTKLDAAQHDLKKSQDDVARLTAEVERMRGVEAECSRLRAELLQERKKREEVERELEHAGLLDTPRPFGTAVQNIPSAVSRTMMYAKSRGLGFRSIDSESSFTDVDEDENRGPELKVVEEVDEADDCESLYDDDDDNELARYEEEDENDEYAFPTSSSYDSVTDYPRSTTPRLSGGSVDSAPALVISRSPSASPSPLPSPAEPTHARHATLVKAWSFPAPGSGVAVVQRQPEEMDRFFACLEDVDNSPPLDSKLRSVESGKNLFSQALADFEDDLPPFVIPSDVGEIVMSPEVEPPQHALDVVVEEEEDEEEEEEGDDDDQDDSHDITVDDEFIGEEDEGGIKFTFGPPPSEYCADADTSTPDLTMASTPESTNKSGHFFEPLDEDEADSSFTFPQLKYQRASPLPSAIPRLRSPSPSPSKPPVTVASTSTPVKASSPLPLPLLSSSPIGFSTPPPKRASTIPTFIPQPRHAVPQTPSPPSVGKVASFIPQPKRSSASPRPSAIPVMTPPTSADAVSRSDAPVTSRAPAPAPAMRAPPLPSRRAFVPSPDSPQAADSQVSPTPASPSLISPTLARLSFQALTNFIPVPSMLWSPRSRGGCFDVSTSDSSMSSSESSSHVRTDSSFVNATTTAVARPAVVARERTFVPKAKQLEKLRLRLEGERRQGGQAVVNGLGIEVKNTQSGVLNI
ncbi:hypothetical protein C2E23DRAFT_100714 [Lenzites betulinus]|nr:hypothetical protein C2E23DRAFT_100714 [Lenzites betulinus]